MSVVRRAMICAAAALPLAARAADLRVPATGDPFAPARPVGIASDLPRSPLADATAFGTERFDRPDDAQARCPGDAVVWVRPLSPAYAPARPGARHAAWPAPGSFMCRSSALSEGDRSR